MSKYGNVSLRAAGGDFSNGPLRTTCTSSACTAKKGFRKQKPGVVQNKLTSDGKRVFGWCRQCGKMYEPITRNGQIPKVGKPKPYN